MGLNYKNTETFPVFGTVARVYNNDKVTVKTATRTPVTLEGTYQNESATVATKSFKVAGFSKMNLSALYTMGATESGNTVEIKIEESPDGVNFYQIMNETATAGVSVLDSREFQVTGVNAGAKPISIGIDIFYEYLRISVKETGVATNKGTIYGEVTLAGF